MKDYTQIEWDQRLEDDCRQLARLAVREDLQRQHDWTTVALVAAGTRGQAAVVTRCDGVVAGLPAAATILDEYDPRIEWQPCVVDGQPVCRGDVVARLSGPARSLLTAERPMLNLLGRLSGVATLARTYVEAVAGTAARIYDTRKTMPGWRRLEKYAVRMGGGCNHRTGLFDGVLIKDNHLAVGAEGHRYSPAEAVRRVREFLVQAGPETAGLLIEVEVDTLEQLDEVLPAGPDIVLLDNMPPDVLRQAVARRDAGFGHVQLEASGGISLETVRTVAESGVERISVGALSHSARWLDLGLDWR